MPKVSVIIPTYNRAGRVVAAVDSVLGQTYEDRGIIVIDDGSTDETKAVLQRYGGKIKCLFAEHDGPIAARNLGIRNSTGKYIAFLDSDDTWLPDKLAAQIEVLERDEDVGLVFTDMYLVDEKGKTEKLFSDWADIVDGRVFRHLLRGNFISMSSVVIRKTCLDRVGALEESAAQIGVEDYHLWLRLTKHFAVKYIDRPLVNYSIGGEDKLTSVDKLDKLARISEVLRDIGGKMDLSGEERRLLRKSAAKNLYEMGRLLSRSGSHEKAVEKFGSAIKLRPLYLRAYYFLLVSFLNAVRASCFL